MYLVPSQVDVSLSHLRSRSSLVLANTFTGCVFLWHGAKALKHTRQVTPLGLITQHSVLLYVLTMTTAWYIDY